MKSVPRGLACPVGKGVLEDINLFYPRTALYLSRAAAFDEFAKDLVRRRSPKIAIVCVILSSHESRLVERSHILPGMRSGRGILNNDGIAMPIPKS